MFDVSFKSDFFALIRKAASFKALMTLFGFFLSTSLSVSQNKMSSICIQQLLKLARSVRRIICKMNGEIYNPMGSLLKLKYCPKKEMVVAVFKVLGIVTVWKASLKSIFVYTFAVFNEALAALEARIDFKLQIGA